MLKNENAKQKIPQSLAFMANDFASIDDYEKAEIEYSLFLIENGLATGKPHKEFMFELAQRFGLDATNLEK